MLQPAFFAATKALRLAAAAATGLPPAALTDITTVFPAGPEAAYQAVLHSHHGGGGGDRLLLQEFDGLVSSDRIAALLRIHPRGAFDSTAVAAMKKLRAVAARPEFAAYQPAVLSGGMGVLSDSVDSVYAKMPVLVAEVMAALSTKTRHLRAQSLNSLQTTKRRNACAVGCAGDRHAALRAGRLGLLLAPDPSPAGRSCLCSCLCGRTYVGARAGLSAGVSSPPALVRASSSVDVLAVRVLATMWVPTMVPARLAVIVFKTACISSALCTFRPHPPST